MSFTLAATGQGAKSTLLTASATGTPHNWGGFRHCVANEYLRTHSEESQEAQLATKQNQTAGNGGINSGFQQTLWAARYSSRCGIQSFVELPEDTGDFGPGDFGVEVERADTVDVADLVALFLHRLKSF